MYGTHKIEGMKALPMIATQLDHLSGSDWRAGLMRCRREEED
jgi:hypothetical protein